MSGLYYRSVLNSGVRSVTVAPSLELKAAKSNSVTCCPNFTFDSAIMPATANERSAAFVGRTLKDLICGAAAGREFVEGTGKGALVGMPFVLLELAMSDELSIKADQRAGSGPPNAGVPLSSMGVRVYQIPRQRREPVGGRHPPSPCGTLYIERALDRLRTKRSNFERLRRNARRH